ncbi:hypothetical protein Pyn_08452 [Prunus yedoensis var. nudiflora]|uniref:Uncharacterized protein n=1 Tax=Prunus yedoensis var. nudiflora TaxID=2094558 RepID=A0A314YPS9_PRUYE|nr:hypothetical protein Pyn_08452 [Prunus yedoensis var. nudiflora]
MQNASWEITFGLQLQNWSQLRRVSRPATKFWLLYMATSEIDVKEIALSLLWYRFINGKKIRYLSVSTDNGVRFESSEGIEEFSTGVQLPCYEAGPSD